MSTIYQCLLMILRDISYTLTVISWTFRWRLLWLVSSTPWTVSWTSITLRMSRVCVRVCSNMPGTVRNHPCGAQYHGATSLEGKIHLTSLFLKNWNFDDWSQIREHKGVFFNYESINSLAIAKWNPIYMTLPQNYVSIYQISLLPWVVALESLNLNLRLIFSDICFCGFLFLMHIH